jgi:hypothetical protein
MTGFADDDRDLLQTIHANQTLVIIPDLRTLDLRIMALASTLAVLDAKLDTLISQGASMSTALDDLKAAEAALATDVMDAVMLIQTLQAAPGTVAAADVEAVVANLTALHTKLLAAAPPPPPGPMEQPTPNNEIAPPPDAGPSGMPAVRNDTDRPPAGP